MPESGSDLGADLWDIYRAGSRHLPAIAEGYRQARAQVSEAGAVAGSAFLRTGPFGEPLGPAYGHWEFLLHMVHDALQNSATYLKETGDALVLAADAYAAVDEEAREEFERFRRRLE